jgi:hypothetical protein
MEEIMPPKLNNSLKRPTLTSVVRASITDERKRLDQVAKNRNISDSGPGKTVKDEIQVTSRCQKNQNSNALQKLNFDIDKYGCTADNEDYEVGVCKTASIYMQG